MDLQRKRQEIIQEMQRCQREAQTHLQEANKLTERATFLSGAIAMLNEQIGAPPAAVPDQQRFWREVAHGWKDQQRQEKKKGRRAA